VTGTDAFQGLILREFLLEDGLRDEFNHAEVASWLGELVGKPAALAVEHFLSGGVLSFVDAGLTQQAILHLVKVKNTTLLLRAAADFLASMKSAEDAYKSCCRSALCHAIQGSWEWAFGALRAAAHKNDNWARHHHIYGLIHGAKGNCGEAIPELERAASAEPYPEPQRRILEAVELARSAAAIRAAPPAAAVTTNVKPRQP
jgi:hypothetical protein